MWPSAMHSVHYSPTTSTTRVTPNLLLQSRAPASRGEARHTGRAAGRCPLPGTTLLTSARGRGGRLIRARGTDLDVVQRPLLSVTLEATEQARAEGPRPLHPNWSQSCAASLQSPTDCIHLDGGQLQVRLCPA